MMKLLTPQERELLLLTSLQKILDGELTEGKVLRQLRKDILGMSQDQYAALVGISRRTLSDIENDTGSQSITVINSVFKPFGLRLGLLPSSKFLFAKLAEAQHSEDVLFTGQDRLSSFKREVHR
jgi:DNA-binding XRE family transcriptional regulator